MMPGRGALAVSVEKCCFDEQDIGAAREIDDLFCIRRCERGVDDVDDLAAPGDVHDLLLEGAERQCGLVVSDTSRP